MLFKPRSLIAGCLLVVTLTGATQAAIVPPLLRKLGRFILGPLTKQPQAKEPLRPLPHSAIRLERQCSGLIAFSSKGLPESRISFFHVNVSRSGKPIRESVAEHRERLRASGRMVLTTHLPVDLIDAIDRHKVEAGIRSRNSIIEDALRLYFERRGSMRA